MTALMIVGIVLACLLVLLCFPVHVRVTYEDSFAVTIRYLFFRYRLWQKEDGEEKEQEFPEKQSQISRRDLKKLMQFGRQMLDLALDAARRLKKHLVLSRLNLNVRVCGEDAAQTALLYGGLCGALYPLYAAVLSTFRVKKSDLQVFPDYHGTAFAFTLDLHARIPLLFLISSLNRVIINMIQMLMRQKKEK